ncbi:MAG TPA: hypothetical protein VGS11_10505 [Candidatus Bathyarchaeia archaeon]|nr:hypothetical protein [Candidatus Bathyarchaeia archaeon]
MASVSKEIERLKELVADLDTRVSKLESPSEPIPSAGTKKLSIREFMLQKGVSTDTDKVVVLGFYLERFSALQSFNITDLEAAFKEAREPVPKNINETVNKNIRKGYIMEAGEKDSKKAWTLTNSGESFVDNGASKPTGTNRKE